MNNPSSAPQKYGQISSCRQLKLESSDGKKYNTDVTDTEGILRIIESIPSPKAEPFKRWLENQDIDFIE